MTYEEQLKAQELNKNIINELLAKYSSEEINDYYYNHTQKESLLYFGLRTVKQLNKLLRLTGYDFSQIKPTLRNCNKPENKRTHESYVTGGKKSSETQKQAWEDKTDEEKQAWSEKMSICHLNSPTFRAKIAESNRAYRNSLTDEQRAEMDTRRSNTMREYWNSLSAEEKEQLKQSCNGKTYNTSNSGPNLAFAKLLSDNNIVFEREYSLERKHYDFKVSDVLIEIDPTFTHNSTFTPFEYNKPLEANYHKQKTELAAKYNFRCVHVFDWDDKNKIVKLLTKRETVYANKCLVKPVDKQEALTFINEYHLQGYAKDSIRYGLYHNDSLVAIMTFGKPRYNKNYDIELVRYCASHNIVGGAEKLFTHFRRDYPGKSVISYCDRSKFNGTTYEKLNFTLVRVNPVSKHWYNPKTKEHYTDALLRQHGFSRLINHCDAANDNLQTNDNRELMISAGFVEIYDCGQAVYEYR